MCAWSANPHSAAISAKRGGTGQPPGRPACPPQQAPVIGRRQALLAEPPFQRARRHAEPACDRGKAFARPGQNTDRGADVCVLACGSLSALPRISAAPSPSLAQHRGNCGENLRGHTGAGLRRKPSISVRPPVRRCAGKGVELGQDDPGRRTRRAQHQHVAAAVGQHRRPFGRRRQMLPGEEGGPAPPGSASPADMLQQRHRGIAVRDQAGRRLIGADAAPCGRPTCPSAVPTEKPRRLSSVCSFLRLRLRQRQGIALPGMDRTARRRGSGRRDGRRPAHRRWRCCSA